MFAGIEGLDDTVKLPAETDAYFARVQAVIDADPAAARGAEAPCSRRDRSASARVGPG